ncbi:LysE family translocator [Actinomadura terrae]|uniref:LysE family translocator n=1 Tax=Actinomadura terrae TaxID=604353 RepID=UPI001FA7B927|nr:LysE family translocator [Actinomadura terrae]
MSPLTPGFFACSAVVIVTPGPDLLLISRLVLRHRAVPPALAAALGMITAGTAQALLGFGGLTLLLQREPALLSALQWAGAAVLAFWGQMILRASLSSRSPPAASAPSGATTVPAAYLQGLLCTGSNPKVGLFLTAFLPQFVPPGAATGPSLALLATAYLAMGLTWLLVWITVMHRVGRHLLTPHTLRLADLVAGTAFILFAIRLALSVRP